MPSMLVRRSLPLLAAALTVTFLPMAGGPAMAGTATAGGGPVRARITGAPIPGTTTGAVPGGQVAAAGLPSKKNQIKVLTAALNLMHKKYAQFAGDTPGPSDIFDYGIGPLWRQGIDGAGTTIAVIEG